MKALIIKTVVFINILLVGAAWADEGMIQVRRFDLPLSELISNEARRDLQKSPRSTFPNRVLNGECDPWPEDIHAGRRCYDQTTMLPLIDRHRARYSVEIEPKTIAGIDTEVFTPAEGIADENQNRILINLHGGGFAVGGRTGGQVESIPIAAVGGINVISIDYRMYPEHTFPAASEDVAAVYKELLKTYKPENIGIYGCSAGGVLTAQSIAWFQKKALPLPGAVGMFCAGGSIRMGGDSKYIIPAIRERQLTPIDQSYHKNADLNDPLVSPVRSAAVLKEFPPSLLITSTRDYMLSAVVYTHSKLVEQGVTADLHVWDGLPHAFLYHSEWPESQEAYDVIVSFFDQHLGM